MSAKGVIEAAQRLLTHELYKDTLLLTKPKLALNTRLNSENHLLKTVRDDKISLSAFDNKGYICLDCLSTLPFGHYSLQSFVESDGENGSLSWFIPNQPDSQISWHFGEDILSKLFKDSQVDWVFQSNALPPPDKRLHKYYSERLNQLLDNARNYSPPDPGLINASNIGDEDISDDQTVYFDRASSSEEEQSFWSLIHFEAS